MEQKHCKWVEKTIYYTPQVDVSEVYKTHAGRISNDNRIQKEFLIKNVNDYETVIFMINDTIYQVDEDAYFYVNQIMGDDGITQIWTDESPYIDAQYFLGYEKWCYDQFDYPQEFTSLIETLEKRKERHLSLLLDYPDKYLINLGNLAGNFSVKQFEKYVFPYFKKYNTKFIKKGKICTIHAAALNLREHKELIKSIGIKVIETFTPPAVGNLSLAEARAEWGEETTIWINFPETIFYKGYDFVKEYTRKLLLSDPCYNKFIGLTDMGFMGVDEKQFLIFKSFVMQFLMLLMNMATINNIKPPQRQ